MNQLIDFANWFTQKHVDRDYHRPVTRFDKVGQSFIDRRDNVELNASQLVLLFYSEMDAAQHDEDMQKLSVTKGSTEFDITAGC